MTLVLVAASVYATGVNAQTAAPIRVVAVGDSITQGESFTDSYRRPLQMLLESSRFAFDFVGSQDAQRNGAPPPNPDFDLEHEGHWGWFANQLRDALPGWLQGYDADLAIIHAGTNDIFFGEDVQGTAQEVVGIIEALRDDNPTIKIVLAQVIPFANDMDGRVEAYNAELFSVAATVTEPTSPIAVVDLFTEFDVATMTYDGIHPNAAGESFMAERIHPFVLSYSGLVQPPQCAATAPGLGVLGRSVPAAFALLGIGLWARRRSRADSL